MNNQNKTDVQAAPEGAAGGAGSRAGGGGRTSP